MELFAQSFRIEAPWSFRGFLQDGLIFVPERGLVTQPVEL